MRRYETIFIIDPDLSDEDRAPLFERLKLLFPQLDGFLVTIDEWGGQRLAYEIKKKPRGYYVRLDYCGTGPLVDEIERSFRIDDRVLKYMTVVTDPDVDLERLKEEVAQAEAEAKAKAEAQQAEQTEQPEQPEQTEEPESEPTIAASDESDDTDSETVQAESDREE